MAKRGGRGKAKKASKSQSASRSQSKSQSKSKGSRSKTPKGGKPKKAASKGSRPLHMTHAYKSANWNSKKYSKMEGTRAEVMNETAQFVKSRSEIKSDLKYNKGGNIVNARASKAALENYRKNKSKYDKIFDKGQAILGIGGGKRTKKAKKGGKARRSAGNSDE